MLYEVMKHCRNFFPVVEKQTEGEFAIEDGTIDLSFMLTGQYFLIEGSALNDGLYLYPATGLTDETFTGVITPLAVPKAFLELVDEISEFEEKATVSPYTSESFGGYSYSRATNSAGNAAGWQDVFKSKLNVWRKM